MKVIVDIKVKVFSLIIFIIIVCVNFEFENCWKIDLCCFVIVRMCVYLILLDLFLKLIYGK